MSTFILSQASVKGTLMCKRAKKRKNSSESFQERVATENNAVKWRNIQNNETYKRAKEMQSKNKEVKNLRYVSIVIASVMTRFHALKAQVVGKKNL